MQCAAYGLSTDGLSTDRLTPPTPSTSAAMLAALIRLFPKHNLWIWRWARALNFFSRPWRGLFWVEPRWPRPALWSWPPCCSSVSGSWQSSYRLRHLYVEQQFFFFQILRVLCYEVPCWTSSDQYERGRVITPNLTHLLPIHTWDLVTLTSDTWHSRENG